MKSQKSLPKPKRRSPLTVRQVSGHSMLPVLPPGTIVFGLKWFRRLRPGNIVIFFHDGREKIKRVSEIKDGQLYVLGDHEEASTDSRHYGWLPEEEVVAKVIWPHSPRHRAEGIEKPEV